MNGPTVGATGPGSCTSDSARAGPDEPVSRRQSRRLRPVWWALGFSALTTVGLGALTSFGVLVETLGVRLVNQLPRGEQGAGRDDTEPGVRPQVGPFKTVGRSVRLFA